MDFLPVSEDLIGVFTSDFLLFYFLSVVFSCFSSVFLDIDLFLVFVSLDTDLESFDLEAYLSFLVDYTCFFSDCTWLLGGIQKWI